MGIQEARDILALELINLSADLAENYTREKQRFYNALEFAVNKLDREIRSYCNLA